MERYEMAFTDLDETPLDFKRAGVGPEPTYEMRGLGELSRIP